MKKFLSELKFSIADTAASFISGWLIAVSCMIMIFPNAGVKVDFINDMNLFLFLSLLLSFGLAVLFLDAYYHEKHVAKYAIVASLIVFSFSLAAKRNDGYTYIVLAAVLLIALYCLNKEVSPAFLHQSASRKVTLGVTITAAVAVTVIVGSISVFRYLTYSAPNYDFGIFCNMFYNMRENLSPVSTCERDQLLSHFAVHISPIFYLLLPFYFIAPSPVTIAVLQPLIIFSGIIPVYLLARHLKLSENTVMFVSFVYAFFTPFASGCFYDMHENCFLVPTLLWLFYCFEKGKNIPMFICMFLVLFVKEDAFIYVAVFAMYLIISRKRAKSGLVMLALGGAYFLLACYLLTTYGNGVMSSRYSNLELDGGLIDAGKTLIMNFGFAISEIFKTKKDDPQKFLYLAELIMPLAFIPFRSKKFSRYILILPIFINLFTRYTYQYDITFQYTFGISAFLIYLCLLNLSDMDKNEQENNSFAAVIMSLLLFVMIVLPKCATYIEKYADNRQDYRIISEAIETIPDDATVTASTFFLPHMAKRSVIYEDEYHEKPSTEYFVLDTRYAAAKNRGQKYIDAGYELIYESDGLIEIYHTGSNK
ncbi:MAG: DUF2079 domain-containing protein [Faecalibacterium sp.]|nr:DUF2079 domain-containing protein [Ruminococcus sp.]MCM1393210.1 DUF2079 domain-containing protein [Ruminococcus sp.]MCM1484986.1 DUF2079 domain-containing protein [Faecalibacterium sp.]